MLRGGRIKRFQFLGGQTDRDHLHRLSPTTRTPTTTTLKLLNVIAGLGLIRPLVDLLFTHHTDIV